MDISDSSPASAPPSYQSSTVHHPPPNAQAAPNESTENLSPTPTPLLPISQISQPMAIPKLPHQKLSNPPTKGRPPKRAAALASNAKMKKLDSPPPVSPTPSAAAEETPDAAPPQVSAAKRRKPSAAAAAAVGLGKPPKRSRVSSVQEVKSQRTPQQDPDATPAAGVGEAMENSLDGILRQLMANVNIIMPRLSVHHLKSLQCYAESLLSLGQQNGGVASAIMQVRAVASLLDKTSETFGNLWNQVKHEYASVQEAVKERTKACELANRQVSHLTSELDFLRATAYHTPLRSVSNLSPGHSTDALRLANPDFESSAPFMTNSRRQGQVAQSILQNFVPSSSSLIQHQQQAQLQKQQLMQQQQQRQQQTQEMSQQQHQQQQHQDHHQKQQLNQQQHMSSLHNRSEIDHLAQSSQAGNGLSLSLPIAHHSSTNFFLQQQQQQQQNQHQQQQQTDFNMLSAFTSTNQSQLPNTQTTGYESIGPSSTLSSSLEHFNLNQNFGQPDSNVSLVQGTLNQNVSFDFSQANNASNQTDMTHNLAAHFPNLPSQAVMQDWFSAPSASISNTSTSIPTLQNGQVNASTSNGLPNLVSYSANSKSDSSLSDLEDNEGTI